MKKLKILIDLDGITADTLPHWLKVCNEMYGTKATVEDIKEWNLHASPALSMLKPEQIFGILNMPGFTLDIPVMPGAVENIEALMALGHSVKFLTARYGDVGMPETLHWMKKHFPFVKPDKQVGFYYDKHDIRGDILVDDKGETLIQYNAANPDSKILTINYAYNQMLIPKAIRVEKNEDSWFALRKLIEGYSA